MIKHNSLIFKHYRYETITSITVTQLDYLHATYRWDNPGHSFIISMMKRYCKKQLNYNIKTNKLYLHLTLRKTSIVRCAKTNNTIRSCVNNYVCDIEIKKPF